MADLSASDVALMSGGLGGLSGGSSCWIWGIVIIALFIFGGGGFNNFFGGRGYGAAALGNELGNFATQNDVQRGFDNQNTMANQREILSAVTAGTAQGVAATNQSFHDMLNVVQDKYNEITRDVAALQVAQQQAIANQNQCCCDTKLLLTEQNAGTNANIAQSRYDAALNTAAINANTTAQTQKILDAISTNKIENLQNQINQLQLQNAVSGMVKYPQASTYNAGMSPFCNCGCNFG